MKKYLLDSSLGPHCLSCRNEISTSDFINFFEKNWRLGVYKEHHKVILFAKEASNFKEAYDEIDKNNKIKDLQEEIRKLNYSIYEHRMKIENLQYGREKTQNEYKYKCPSENCNGSLNSNYKCIICEINYCKDCFEEIEDIETHECDEDLKETVKEIKKQAKPCPNCGTMISKISGCAQLFCTNGTCGTAFNWNTGAIEQGVIHNPEAYGYFERHPDKKTEYLNRLNGNNRNNNNNNPNCLVSQYELGDKLKALGVVSQNYYNNGIMPSLVRNIYNFRNYRRVPTETNNLDLKLKFVRNEITEVNMKKTLFMRHKRFEKERIDYQILDTTAYVLNDILKSVLLCENIDEYNNLINTELKEIVDYTNEQLEINGKYFGLKAVVIDGSFYRF
jgi:hypothetical protein